MLVKIKRLKIINNGYKRDVSHEDIYVNSDSILSISDYVNINNFLLQESSTHASEKYSLIKLKQGTGIEEIIALGSAEHISDIINNSKKRILHG